MKNVLSTFLFTVTFGATLNLDNSISSIDTASCPESIRIIGLPVFEKQVDGSFLNEDDSLIVKNEDDSTWFIMDPNLGTVISFDQAKCPTENKNWHLLDLENMSYSDYDIQFL